MDIKEIQNKVYAELGVHLPEHDPILQFLLIEQAILAAHKEVNQQASENVEELAKTSNHLHQHINKLESTSNTIVAATSEMLKEIDHLSSEAKQSVFFSIQMLRKYMKDELPTIVNGIDPTPLSKKIQDELIRTITLDTQKIRDAATTQSNITSELMKLGQSISASAAKAKQASATMTAYSNKQNKTILYVVGGSAFVIGLLLGGILIKSIG